VTEEFDKKLYVLLINVYRSILKIEEGFMSRAGMPNISSSEMHMIDVIGSGKDGHRTVKEIALALHITQPSVTTAINRLEKKGCVERVRSKEDRREVHIHLTRLGKKIHSLFLRFHSNMVRSIADDLTDEEQMHLIRAMIKLNTYFSQQAEHNTPTARNHFNNEVYMPEIENETEDDQQQ